MPSVMAGSGAGSFSTIPVPEASPWGVVWENVPVPMGLACQGLDLLGGVHGHSSTCGPALRSSIGLPQGKGSVCSPTASPPLPPKTFGVLRDGTGTQGCFLIHLGGEIDVLSQAPGENMVFHRHSMPMHPA